jgi:hypothetical protein
VRRASNPEGERDDSLLFPPDGKRAGDAISFNGTELVVEEVA